MLKHEMKAPEGKSGSIYLSSSARYDVDGNGLVIVEPCDLGEMLRHGFKVTRFDVEGSAPVIASDAPLIADLPAVDPEAAADAAPGRPAARIELF